MLGMLGAVPLAAGGVLAPGGAAYAGSVNSTPTGSELAAGIQAIIERPAFAGSRWGMAFAAADTGDVVYALRPDELFVAASSFKVFVAGTAFEALGPNHRFRTRVYRTGPVVRGVLRGDLVLVAGGDLLLSGRRRPDGTLYLPDPDPTYPGGVPLPDPLREIRDLAGQVAAAGVRRVEGQILVDASLFREAQEGVFMGDTRITVSPMMVNDHVVHAVVTPGGAAGASGIVRAVPQTGYLRFVSQVTTVPASGPARPLAFGDDVTNADGSRTVTVIGDIPLGAQPRFVAYFVPSPTRFAGTVLAEALHALGVTVGGGIEAAPTGWRGARLAEHVSPPLAEQVKVMLKVSSNVHTVTFPYLVGAVAGRDSVTPKATYEQYLRQLFRAAGLDPDLAGAAEGSYTANTFIRFLTHIKRRPYFAQYRQALPIMGSDGSIAGNQPNSPAAGHVFAKTGTGGLATPTGGALLHKALAGYIELPDRRWLTFAQFMRQETTFEAVRSLGDQAQEAMAEIATVIYETLARSPR
ncbi:D-alanyl-D-alanine carboxypeptidase / D-alanyl-D-alanine-endopeptidase (penicillin-binding protein 4) [Micromonospora eburnea]|uniref:D-alanyl-D-alanine carboxypeptidase / D-alanyl-D-alanine-endopeptidase (Penicillin-binding protein 4) n=1 Tax=Micromonospora eburnea TaxID=227316 RepID=A0A1C6VAE2_9ACTN|nr:D-alanyl-D-alanine carboxypeptidase / D-alanyl-D-alanine-endopeptidase (penicillin-binding protein 4) [Micromonospora eburnea]